MARYRKRYRSSRKRNGGLKLLFTSPVRRNALIAGMALAFISTGWEFGRKGVSYGNALANKLKGVVS
jgi:hypothetical protein